MAHIARYVTLTAYVDCFLIQGREYLLLQPQKLCLKLRSEDAGRRMCYEPISFPAKSNSRSPELRYK